MATGEKLSFVDQVRFRDVKVRWVLQERLASAHALPVSLLLIAAQAEQKASNAAYLQSHPEINAMLNDFMTSMLLQKPDDPYAFASQHFALIGTAIGLDSAQGEAEGKQGS
ncbi:catip [Symbiodinium sp. KB8]|nr:catip [Symbiodinium sp. KB8]